LVIVNGSQVCCLEFMTHLSSLLSRCLAASAGMVVRIRV